MKKLLAMTLPAVMAFSVMTASAQKFAIPLEGFSTKKTSYLHMEDGTVFEGTLSGFKRSKGLVETVKMKNADGDKLKIDPADIKFMYIPPSALAKLGAKMEQINNVDMWDKEANIDKKLMGESYVYFETTSCELKKGTEVLMLQLMNAPFSSSIRVYHDPKAKETMGVGVAGVTVAGGIDKSYYVKKKGEETAYRIKKKDYEEDFMRLFGDKPDFVAKYKDNLKWDDLETHIFEYSQM